MKYRKKPIVIEAVQLRWETWEEMCEFANVGSLKANRPSGIKDLPNNAIGLHIPTPEGLMTANENDYIIKGINGELYPCKPDIFEQTYEKL